MIQLSVEQDKHGLSNLLDIGVVAKGPLDWNEKVVLKARGNRRLGQLTVFIIETANQYWQLGP